MNKFIVVDDVSKVIFTTNNIERAIKVMYEAFFKKIDNNNRLIINNLNEYKDKFRSSIELDLFGNPIYNLLYLS